MSRDSADTDARVGGRETRLKLTFSACFSATSFRTVGAVDSKTWRIAAGASFGRARFVSRGTSSGSMGCLVDADEDEDDASNRRRAGQETGDGECDAWNSGAGADCSA